MALNPAQLDSVIESMNAAAAALTQSIRTTVPIAPAKASTDSSSIPLTQSAVTIVATRDGSIQGNVMVCFTQDVTVELGTVAEMLTALAPAFAEAGRAMGVSIGQPTLASGTPTVAADVAVPLMMSGLPVGGFLLFAADQAAQETPAAAPKANSKNVNRKIDVTRIDALTNVQMEVTVEIGRTRLPIGELLALTPGQVIELDRPAGALVDLYINGTMLAKGEIVVIDEEYGFRVTEIVSEEN